ncbi:cytochrome c family protein [Pseudomonas sp. W22_MBD1_FP4]|uniref:c-type cytochrome n=1 Tax=Pseudomonas sp. W22_MBD1_FP4 TaxID=3240272 RepID=UPI003F99C967
MKKASLVLLFILFSKMAVAADGNCSPETAEKAWAKCAACHSLAEGNTSMLGPNLHGVIGRKAGSLGGFIYSPAMKASEIVFTAEKLDAFLADPQSVVPRNRMPFSGLKNSEDRAAVICKIKAT